jgi:predicted PurR-regulated permease PerM
MAIFSRRRHSWLYIIWVIVGLVVAWTHSYITVYLLKLVLSALLAIILWPLVLLGVSLHIH